MAKKEGKKEIILERLQPEDFLKTNEPEISFDNVVGLESAKKFLKEEVILPIQYPKLLEGEKKYYKGILLSGPPGTGKSYLAEAVMNELKGKFFWVSYSNIFDKYSKEPEIIITAAFEWARKYRPSVLFFDDIDSILSSKAEEDRELLTQEFSAIQSELSPYYPKIKKSDILKTEFCIQMQGTGKEDKDIIVIGATNNPLGLDPNVRKIFQKEIELPLPDENDRKLMIKLNLGNMQNDLTEKQFIDLAGLTKGFSCLDIYYLTSDAVFEPVRKIQSATHFKITDKNNLTPCSPSDPGAKEIKFDEIAPESLALPIVTFEDFIFTFKNMKKNLAKKGIQQSQKPFFEEFNNEE